MAQGDVSRAPWARLVLASSAFAVIAIYALIACTEESELGNRTAGEAYYNRLADGLAKGRLSLDLEPPAGLARLANPYDRDANLPYRGTLYARGRMHDLTYYKGRLYLYFSVIPAVLLFLPYHVVTGGYLSHQGACLAFSGVGFMASAALLERMRRACFPQLGLGSAAFGILCMGLVPMVPIILQRPDVWEVPVTASYAFWMISLGILWSYLNGPPRAWTTIACLSAAVGLAVGCRPDSLLASIVLAWPLLRALRSGGDGETRGRWASVGAALLPLAAIGALLAAYNYGRFGSFLEFGQGYHLGGEAAQAHPRRFGAGFFWYNFRLYFLANPGWQGSFPFVRHMVLPPLPEGYSAEYGVVGVLTLLPFTLMGAAAPLGIQEAHEDRAAALRAMVGATASLAAAVVLPLCFFYGAVDRYELEFVPEMALLAVLGLFALESRYGHSVAKVSCVRAIALLLAVASVAFNLLTVAARRATLLSLQGNQAMEERHWDEAAGLYRRSLRLAPGSLDTVLALGRSYEGAERMSEASRVFEAALLAYPDSVDARLSDAWCLYRLNRSEEARAQCREVLRRSPSSKAAQALLRMIGGPSP